MSGISIRRNFARPMTEVPVMSGLGTIDEVMDEMMAMTDVVLGRRQPPLDHGVMTRHEVCLAYHARVTEIEILIYEYERKVKPIRGDAWSQLRTRQVRSMIDMLKAQVQAGSRALTHEQFLYQLQTDAGA